MQILREWGTRSAVAANQSGQNPRVRARLLSVIFSLAPPYKDFPSSPLPQNFSYFLPPSASVRITALLPLSLFLSSSFSSLTLLLFCHSTSTRKAVVSGQFYLEPFLVKDKKHNRHHGVRFFSPSLSFPALLSGLGWVGHPPLLETAG